MLSQSHRISNQRLISKLNKEGKAYRTSHFVFKFLPSHFDTPKFAPVVSKKVLAKAVDRNKVRRQITESLRHNLDSLKKPVVCLIILKKNISDYSEVDAQVKEFFKHLQADV